MYSWKDGSRYVGQLDSGLFEGFGVYTYEPDNVYEQYEGVWRNDKQVSYLSNKPSHYIAKIIRDFHKSSRSF